MPLILTDKATIMCSHGGTFELTASQSKLVIEGGNALVDGDLLTATMSNCPNSVSPAVPCTGVLSTAGGVAQNTKVDGKGVLLDNVQGTTIGTAGTLVVSAAGQTKFNTT